MVVESRQPVRVLIADDEAEMRDTYRQILVPSNEGANADKFRQLQSRLYGAKGAAQPRAPKRSASNGLYDAVFCAGADAAVDAVRESLAAGTPFAIAFLDMRMPPGPDGVWAAARIRELDPAIEIVICTAFSDIEAAEIAELVQPAEKLSYVQKPFHPDEIRQTALSLASKWHAERRIIKLAYFDPLTGLPNREQSRNRLTSAMAAAGQRGRPLAVLYLDLDNFKRVNDTLGHSVGDELLCVVASRLRESLRDGAGASGGAGAGGAGAGLSGGAGANGGAGAGGVPGGPLAAHVSRLGGDEFIVLLPDLDSLDEPARVAARLIGDLRQPIQLDRHALVMTPSIGIAIYPRDGADVDTLLRHADLAMYFAKRASPGMFEFFHSGMNDAALKRFALEGKLRGALQRGELTLQYQPQFDVLTGRVSGMEALLRWNNDELGNVAPADFIPVAESTGLILDIGEWTLRTACRQAKAWCDEGLRAVRMAVNVSGRQFALKDFPSRVAAIIEETGIDASMLELEITESVVMTDEDASERAFAQLKALGVSLAIDDFGTGYSSFSRLRYFSVSRLKIDRSFVTSLVECIDDRAIASAIIAMSRSLRISVTAEGVETFPQLAFLQEQACHEAQGYFLSPPLSSSEALAFLRRDAEASDASRSARLRAIVL